MFERLSFLLLNSVRTPVEPGTQLSVRDCPTTKEGFRAMSTVDYRGAVGYLLLLASAIRPNISFAVSQASRFLEYSGEAHWATVKRICRYLAGTKELAIVYTSDAMHHNDVESYYSYDRLCGLELRYMQGHSSFSNWLCLLSRRWSGVLGVTQTAVGNSVDYGGRVHGSVCSCTGEFVDEDDLGGASTGGPKACGSL